MIRASAQRLNKVNSCLFGCPMGGRLALFELVLQPCFPIYPYYVSSEFSDYWGGGGKCFYTFS